ncbi:MAG: hypothetical protein IJC49_02570 [Clostridia bacterium]|nr:hypothetical protein [Clostridia bacterium]
MLKETLQKLTKIKGIGYVALALIAGIALLLVNTGEGAELPVEDKNTVFIENAEKTLRDLGGKVCGVKCVAAVSVSGGYTYTYASDQSVRTVYNADGTVAEKEATLTGKTVNLNGGTSLVPLKESPPKISGVAVVCRGASANDVKALKVMIQALYGLEEQSVFVTN